MYQNCQNYLANTCTIETVGEALLYKTGFDTITVTLKIWMGVG